MKTLFANQQRTKDFFHNCHLVGSNTLDSSAVGTGKTVVAAHLAKDLGRPVAVLCPKAVIPTWERELKDHGVTPLFVSNFEKIRTGKTKWMSKAGKKIMRWSLPQDTLVLVDEIHKAKGPYTQNAQLVISLVSQGFSVHGMSATAAEDPTEMRPLGYMLNLHSLNKPENGKKSWYSWMQEHGCYQDAWGGWVMATRNHLHKIRNAVYGVCGARLTVADFPNSFKENRVIVEPVNFSDLSKITKAYDSIGLTPQIMEDYILTGSLPDSDHVLVKILRARQLAESLKAPDLVDMAKDYIDTGHSVVLFVNFSETVDVLCSVLDAPKIDGRQSASERQSVVDAFQKDEIRCLVVNTAAGGTGLSLHDINGNYPRISLISPSFNAKDHMQVLGRIHRNGAKSDAVQKVLVAAGTVEENVMKAINHKILNLKELHEVQ